MFLGKNLIFKHNDNYGSANHRIIYKLLLKYWIFKHFSFLLKFPIYIIENSFKIGWPLLNYSGYNMVYYGFQIAYNIL